MNIQGLMEVCKEIGKIQDFSLLPASAEASFLSGLRGSPSLLGAEETVTMAIERKALWEPAWKGPIEGWTVNFTAKNLWRVAPLYEFEDLVQEAYTVFLRCIRAYPEVFEPAHFMALYQRSVMRHLIDLSNIRTAERNIRPPKDQLREQLRDRLAQPSKELQETDLNLLLEDAPKALQDFAEAFYALPRAASAIWRDLDTGWRETRATRVRRLFGRKGWKETRKWLMDLEIPMLENMLSV